MSLTPAAKLEGARDGAPYTALCRLGLSLPPARPPVANFVPAVIEGDLVYLSGQGPIGPQGLVHRGKVGAELSVKEGYAAARLTTLNLLSALEDGRRFADPRPKGDQGFGHGQRHPRIQRAPNGHQWLFGPSDRGFRSGDRRACAFGRGHGIAARPDRRRDRDDRRNL